MNTLFDFAVENARRQFPSRRGDVRVSTPVQETQPAAGTGGGFPASFCGHGGEFQIVTEGMAVCAVCASEQEKD